MTREEYWEKRKEIEEYENEVTKNGLLEFDEKPCWFFMRRKFIDFKEENKSFVTTDEKFAKRFHQKRDDYEMYESTFKNPLP